MTKKLWEQRYAMVGGKASNSAAVPAAVIYPKPPKEVVVKYPFLRDAVVREHVSGARVQKCP